MVSSSDEALRESRPAGRPPPGAAMNPEFGARLRCPACAGALEPTAPQERPDVREGALHCRCGQSFPVIAGVPRILPDELMPTLLSEQEEFFQRHPGLRPACAASRPSATLSTLRAFGDEWQRFPEIHTIHERIFSWYFEGAGGVAWRGLYALDAGCGMGRWLHFARRAGAHVVGMDVSPAIDVAAAREGGDLVQADLRYPPFAPGAFDLVFSLGVLHHLEDPVQGLRALARLVRPGGELRIYVYRSLDGEPWPRRALLGLVTLLRRVTTRLPYALVHGVAALVAWVATLFFLWPRRLLRGNPLGERLTRGLPLVHYANVPFRMLVAEQFDRLVAPIEGRFRREEVEAWIRAVGFEVVETRAELGWRVVARRPTAAPCEGPGSLPSRPSVGRGGASSGAALGPAGDSRPHADPGRHGQNAVHVQRFHASPEPASGG